MATRNATVTLLSGDRRLTIREKDGGEVVAEYRWPAEADGRVFDDFEEVSFAQLATDLGIAQGSLASALTSAFAASQGRKGYV